MKVTSDYLVSFLPGLLVEYLAQNPATPRNWSVETSELVAVQMDVSGFSTLSERLTREGSAGIEEIVDLLDHYFAALVATIHAHGGDTVGFGGDSVIAVWHPTSEQPLESQAIAAASCALAIQRRISDIAAAESRALGFRIGIGVGPAHQMHLGGHGGRWFFTVAGDALIDMGRAMQLGVSGSVVASRGVVDLLEDHARLSVRAEGHAVVESVRDPPQSDHVIRQLDSSALQAASAYLPVADLEEVAAAGPEWVAEHRPTTALLVNLPDLDVGSQSSQAKLQQVVHLFQQYLLRFDGFISGVMADEKGITLIAGFGLPHHAVAESGIKAVATGRLIDDKLREMRLKHGIGLGSGRTFCSIYGSDVFRQYTFIGPSVNVAARLMVAAQNEVLCDSATMRATRRRIQFSKLRPLQVKGFTEAVDAYRPDWDLTSGVADDLQRAEPGRLLGRDTERGAIAARLGSAVAGDFGAIVIEGEAGIGKTVLAGEALRIAESLGMRSVLGSADPVGGSPYHAWRSVVASALGLEDTYDPSVRAQKVRAALSETPDLIELAPLLNPILDLGLPETDVVLNMTSEGRRERTADLVASLIASFSDERLVLLAVDDVQWMDDASWHVLERVFETHDRLTLLLMTRPLEGNPPGFFARLTGDQSNLHLRLDRIDAISSRRLASEVLGVDRLPEPISEFIAVRGEGHPLFTEELAYHLRDHGYITVSGREATLNVPEARIEDIDLPNSVQELIVSRIEKLTAPEQMTIKVASIVGGTLDPAVLASLHPDMTAEDVNEHLRRLANMDVLRSVGDRYQFKHVITRDSVYERMPASLRRELHERFARQLESETIDEHVFATLAHHWDKAGNVHRSLNYWEASGAAALLRGAAQDAIRFYRTCIDDVAAEGIDGVGVERRAYWQTQMGEAYGELGRIDEGIGHDQRALEMLGFPLPRSAAGEIWRLIRGVVGQVKNLIWGTNPEGVRIGPSRQAAGILAKLSPAYYYKGELRRWAMVSFEAVNRAEGAGDPAIAGLAYISLGTLVGVLRLRKQSFRYFNLARTPLRVSPTEGQTGKVAAGIAPELTRLNAVGADLAQAVVLVQGKGDHLDEVLDLLSRALAQARRLEAHQYRGAILAVRGFSHSLRSPRDEALRDLRDVAELGRHRGQPQHEAWGLALQVPLLVDGEQLEEALEISDRAEGVLHLADPISRPIHLGSRARALGELGREQTTEVIEEALGHLHALPIFLYLTAFTNLALAMLATRDANPHFGRDWRRMLRRFRWYAWMLPFASDHARYVAALGHEEAGHRRRAQRNFERASRQAGRSGHFWCLARCHEGMARIAPAGSSQSQRHREAAASLYAGLEGRRAA